MTGSTLAARRARPWTDALGRRFVAALVALARWRREGETVRQLSRLSDRQLDDIGLSRDTLRDTVRRMSRYPGPR